MSSPADANTQSGSSSTDAILFVEDYNIFYIPDVGIEEKKIFPLSQTEVVKPEVIFHGIPDWIYEGTIIPYLVFIYLFVPKNLWVAISETAQSSNFGFTFLKLQLGTLTFVVRLESQQFWETFQHFYSYVM